MVTAREFRVVWVREGIGAGLPETETGDATVTYTGAALEIAAP